MTLIHFWSPFRSFRSIASLLLISDFFILPSLTSLFLFHPLQIRLWLQNAPAQATPSVNANLVLSACQTSHVKCARNVPGEFLSSYGMCSSHLSSVLLHNTMMKAEKSATPTLYSLNLSASAPALDHHIQ